MLLALLATGRVQLNGLWDRVEDIVAGIVGSRKGAAEHTAG